MRPRIRAVFFASLLTLAACAHPTVYQPADSPNGEGYTTQQIEQNRFRVSFRGNSYTPRQTVDTYMLYRCAEVTLQQGGDYFVVVNDAVDKNTAYESYGDELAWGWGGGWGWRHGWGWGGPAGPVYTQPINSYDAVADMVIYKGSKPADNPHAFDAHDVMATVGPTVQRLPAPGPGTM